MHVGMIVFVWVNIGNAYVYRCVCVCVCVCENLGKVYVRTQTDVCACACVHSRIKRLAKKVKKIGKFFYQWLNKQFLYGNKRVRFLNLYHKWWSSAQIKAGVSFIFQKSGLQIFMKALARQATICSPRQ